MGQALYRTYRSKSLDEIVGQEHITKTLSNALKAGKLSHAYLFTGPRGVGKTSIARILAHEINGLPYDDQAHLDIIEIDAASNRRIDEIRDLRDRVNTAPASAQYKVYIIDEVHMLTKEAFNALLKTLEEPPAHVVFILATTESHKLPDTIISRTQRYSFRPVPVDRVVAHLRYIADKEKITIDDAALELIAQHGDGSFRDSISLLDQIRNTTDHVGRDDVAQILGLAPEERIVALKDALESQQVTNIISTLDELYLQGYEPAQLALQLGGQLRADLLTSGASTHLTLLRALLEVPAARNPKQLLEILLLQQLPQPAAVPKPAPTVIEPSVATVKAAQVRESTIATTVKFKPKAEQVAPIVATPTAEPEPISEIAQEVVTPAEPQQITTDDAEAWTKLLDSIKKQYNTLYGILRMAVPSFDDDTLTLRFGFAFHERRIKEAKNRKIISELLQGITGRSFEIICKLEKQPQPGSIKPKPAEQTGVVSNISNIFGGAELLES